MDDLDCGPHFLTFQSGTDTASVNISLVNDNVPECDEKFIAHIIFGDMTGDGFRLGQQSSTSITIMDEGNGDRSFIAVCVHSVFRATAWSCYPYCHS